MKPTDPLLVKAFNLDLVMKIDVYGVASRVQHKLQLGAVLRGDPQLQEAEPINPSRQKEPLPFVPLALPHKASLGVERCHFDHILIEHVYLEISREHEVKPLLTSVASHSDGVALCLLEEVNSQDSLPTQVVKRLQ